MASNLGSDSKTAFIKMLSGVKLLILMPGDLTPELAYEFAHACHAFFHTKDIEAKDQVKKVMVCFRDIHIVNYIDSNLEDLEKLSFTEFMVNICKHYLKEDWEQDLWRKLLGSKQNGQKFWDFYQGVIKLNIMLKNMDSYYETSTFATSLRNIPSKKGSSTSGAESSGKSKHTPCLTNREHQYLIKTWGCFKCCCPHAGHYLDKYTEEYLKPGQPKIPSDWIPKKKDGKRTGTTSSSVTTNVNASTSVLKAKPVAAFLAWNEDEDLVAAILLCGSLLHSAIIEKAKLTDEVSIDDYQAPYYCWKCLANGPTIIEPIPVVSLIDCGAHLTLITPELVAQLEL
ncbi:hypothetical protein C0995_011503 [Termitomyces sp. Mi166|nr:hypothetical protein C0995_011503 [Termitomyces sp. Mi166\